MTNLKDALLLALSDFSTEVRYDYTDMQTDYNFYVYEHSDFTLEFRVSEVSFNTYRVRIAIIRNGNKYIHGTSCEIYVKTAFEAIRKAIEEAILTIKQKEDKQ